MTRRPLLSLLTLLAAALAVIASNTLVAFASTNTATQTRARANAPAITIRVGSGQQIVAGDVGRVGHDYDQPASATGVATEAGGEGSPQLVRRDLR